MLKIAWDPVYNHPLPEGHRFPMDKYDLIPQQLLWEGTITEENIYHPYPLQEEIILKTHNENYWRKLREGTLSPREIRKTGFPYSKELVEREIIIMQGTLQCSLFAMEHGVALNVAGGTHHAYTDRGEGFCLLNDMAIAANYLLDKKMAQKILIVDLDVHQGNGTAEIFQGSEVVFTFSMHGQNNYPLIKEKSTLDVPLPDKIDDKAYMALLKNHLPQILDSFQPDYIFYQSGVDVLETDKLGKLGMTREGCKERDRIVLETCKKNKIPVCISMGGGYSERIADIVEAHCNTFRLAQEIFF